MKIQNSRQRTATPLLTAAATAGFPPLPCELCNILQTQGHTQTKKTTTTKQYIYIYIHWGPSFNIYRNTRTTLRAADKTSIGSFQYGAKYRYEQKHISSYVQKIHYGSAPPLPSMSLGRIGPAPHCHRYLVSYLVPDIYGTRYGARFGARSSPDPHKGINLGRLQADLLESIGKSYKNKPVFCQGRGSRWDTLQATV